MNAAGWEAEQIKQHRAEVSGYAALLVFLLLTLWGAMARAQGLAGAGVPPVNGYITQFIPPPSFRQWYEEAEACAKMRGNYDAVEWFVVPAPWQTPSGKTHGEWRLRQRHDRLSVSDPLRNAVAVLLQAHHYIVVNAEEWRNPELIRHEALHDILWYNGFRAADSTVEATHPSPPFGDCAKVYW